MQEAIFTLQTITPLFLAGADQSTAELRAPSFRGAMRYWLRSLVGGGYGTDPDGLKKVIAAETAVFGATEIGSAVRVKVSGASRKPDQFTERTNIQVRGEWKATGKGYLLWSMSRSGNAARGNEKPARWYYPLGTQFQVTISAQDREAAGVQALQQAISSFWLLTRLGGMGSRSRRCGGNFDIVQAEGNVTDLAFDSAGTAQSLKQQIEQSIRVARSLFHVTPHTQNSPQFDTMAPGSCRIWILPGSSVSWRNADEAMRVMGEELQSYRSTVPFQQRRVFGLPLKGINERRSSPLHLRVVKLQQDKYAGIATLFKTRATGIPMSDYGHIEGWITTSFPGALEVSL